MNQNTHTNKQTNKQTNKHYNMLWQEHTITLRDHSSHMSIQCIVRRWGIGLENKERSKPLMANLDITHIASTEEEGSTSSFLQCNDTCIRSRNTVQATLFNNTPEFELIAMQRQGK